MNLTILGNNGPFPSAGGACSGYLIREGNKRILIDCGNGVLANLLKFIKFEELDSIILTHLHSDHMSDMMVLRYAVQIKMNRGLINKPINVYAPSEPKDEYDRINIKNIFNLNPISSGLVLSYDNLKITFAEMKHPVKCFAVSIDNGNKRFVFSGDTSWDANIIGFSKGADTLMLDAGLLSKDKKNDNVPHLTARECGVVAKEAGANRLLLTHFWPEDDIVNHLLEARENFENVEIAKLLHTYDI
ncbi:MAG: MBL fold metallo-hydrolase [Bacillota bacterium]